MSLEVVNEVLFELRRLGLDYRSNPNGPDGPWRAQCPLCASLSEPDDLPLTITNRGHFRCRHRCDPEKIAAALDGSAPSLQLPTLPFVSAAELKASTPLEPFWVVDGYLAEGNITLLSGRPKAGKSTLAFDLSAAVANEAMGFLGKLVTGGPVVYVSEEPAATLAHKLPDCDAMRILTRESVWPKPDWPTLVEAAVTEAQRVRAKLLVIDTLAYWASMPAEREKDSGAALAVMESAVYAAREGVAVFLPTHTRKGGGEDRACAAGPPGRLRRHHPRDGAHSGRSAVPRDLGAEPLSTDARHACDRAGRQPRVASRQRRRRPQRRPHDRNTPASR